jgi:hypothetical protein
MTADRVAVLFHDAAGDEWQDALVTIYTAAQTFDTTDGVVDTVLSALVQMSTRLGAWTGTGVNTVLGAFRALLSKTASTPSDIGGTFSATTDSTEAISEAVAAVDTAIDDLAVTPMVLP